MTKILSITIYLSKVHTKTNTATTNRNEKACRTILTQKHSRKQLQPGVVPIHDQVSSLLLLQLPKPGILTCKVGGCVRFRKIEDDIQERRDRAGRNGFDTGHGNGRGGGVGGERHGRAIPD